jgi:hypothetical protein
LDQEKLIAQAKRLAKERRARRRKLEGQAIKRSKARAAAILDPKLGGVEGQEKVDILDALSRTKEVYGQHWPLEANQLTIELQCFLLGTGHGREFHFWKAVELLWGEHNELKKFVRNSFSERIIHAASNHLYLAVAGSASSSKSDTAAVWAIINYLADPLNTCVLVTSTSLKEARKRIWGSIREYWQAVPGLPGDLVDSAGQIKFKDPLGIHQRPSDKVGITLIAGEKKREKEAVGKLIGMKAPRVIMIGDELSELSEAILTAAFGNLSSNPYFQLIGLSNPASYYDPFGILATPKDGWKSINVESEEWETERGWAIHLDGEKNPNIEAGEDLYPWMLTSKKLDDYRKRLGENSAQWWRMVRGFWCPEGDDSLCYTESEIISAGADRPAVWERDRTRIAALDPAFTNGGDRSVLHFGWFGHDKDGRPQLEFDTYEYLTEDLSKDTPRNFQIAEKFRDACVREGVEPQHAALDATGAGIPFADIVQQVWSSRVLRVQFGGAASTNPVSPGDPRPANEAYANRVTELWMRGKEYLRNKQLFGIHPDLVREMTARRLFMKKDQGLRLFVESKTDMKTRIAKSPDMADAAFLLIELARARLAFGGKSLTPQTRSAGWQKFLRKFDIAASSPRLTTDLFSL